MGTWGTAILSNDTAADVAGEFKDSIADGKTIEEAEDQLIADFSIDDESDPYELCPFWLGLAAKQVQMGRLSERTKANALRIIDEGIDIAIWQEENPKLVPKRQAALDKLRAQIVGPQKQPTKVRKPFTDTIEWEPGDVLAYQLPSGNWTALVVQQVDRSKPHQIANFLMLDIHQPSQPTEAEVREAPLRLMPRFEASLHGFISEQRLHETVADWLTNSIKYCQSDIPIPVTAAQPLDSEKTDTLQYILRNAFDDLSFWQSRSSARDAPPGKMFKVAERFRLPGIEASIGFRSYYCGGWERIDEHLKRDYGFE